MPDKKAICPPFLKPGDSVGVVAPSRKISDAELQPAIATLQSWGLTVKTGKNIYSSYNQFAGNDNARASDFQSMLDDTLVKAIFCARGGYGALRMIDLIDFSGFTAHPKWIVGYSDATVFHSHIARYTSAESLHAAMPFDFKKDSESLELLRKTLFGEPIEYTLVPHPLNRNGAGIGALAGGNLSLLYALASTPSDLDFSGKILFIEDLDEYLYHLDRMMQQLKRAGKLGKLKGLIVGSFTEMKDNTTPFGKTAEEIIAEAVEEYEYPVCYGFPAGHGTKNYPLIMSRKAEVNVGSGVVRFSQKW